MNSNIQTNSVFENTTETLSNVAQEADWDSAPGLLDNPIDDSMTADRCGIEYWIKNVTQGTWANLTHGYVSGQGAIPSYLFEPGPLRDTLLSEFAFRASSEEMGTRALGFMVAYAPCTATMDFFATQLIDEARHAETFRQHIIDLGVSEQNLEEELQAICGEEIDNVLVPLEKYGMEVLQENKDFYGGASLLTILVEGVLAPSSELSERKWRLLNPVAADIGRGANIDEIRHLGVGADVIRKKVKHDPIAKQGILDVIMQGQALWATLPVVETMVKRETLFQMGMQEHKVLLNEYELYPGRRLIDTTVEERLGLSMEWSKQLQISRLKYMGLDEAVALM